MSNGIAPIVTIGGGTGQKHLLAALAARYRRVSGIVTLADDGGDSGRWIDSYGTQPPGDERQLLIGLLDGVRLGSVDGVGDLKKLVGDWLDWRPNTGHAQGFPVGNFLIGSLEAYLMKLGFKENANFLALAILNRLFPTTGDIIPVTKDKVTLHLELPDGTVIVGEDKIGEGCAGRGYFPRGVVPKLYYQPPATAAPGAVESIMSAAMVVVSAGKIFSSIAPCLIFKEIAQALVETPAKVVYVMPIMTLPGQTDGMPASEHVEALHGIVGASFIDAVVCNSKRPPQALLKQYAAEGEEPVVIDRARLRGMGLKVATGDLLSTEPYVRQEGDPLPRTVIRHGENALGDRVMGELYRH
jgi:uncharacterized cofD-like protein